jgi:hypothetical protein
MTQTPQDFSPMPPPTMQTAPGFPPLLNPPQHGWFRRNMAWLIPCGCLAMLVIFAGLIGGAVLLGVHEIRKMAPYEEAVERARSSGDVIEALGKPIKAGMLSQISINTRNSVGSAQMTIPIYGPKGKGVIHADATKSGGAWSFSRLEVRIEGRSEPIDLLRRTVI